MNKEQAKEALARALAVPNEQQFINMYEWVCNGHPLYVGERIFEQWFTNGKP